MGSKEKQQWQATGHTLFELFFERAGVQGTVNRTDERKAATWRDGGDYLGLVEWASGYWSVLTSIGGVLDNSQERCKDPFLAKEFQRVGEQMLEEFLAARGE